MSLSTTLSALQARFLRDFAGRGAFGEAADFARALKQAAREARDLEEARRQHREMLEIAADLDAHSLVAPPPELARALRSGRSGDLRLSELPQPAPSRPSSRPNPVAAAATAIPGTNVTVFPVVPRPIPSTPLTNRDLGDEDDGAAT